jgi:hypothetical protein
MTNPNLIENVSRSLSDICDPAIAVVEELVALNDLNEEELAKLERNVRHLELFDYPTAAQAIASGKSMLESYS